MNTVQTWGEAISYSLINLWVRFIEYLPTVIGALLVFLLGVIIASVLGKLVERLFKLARIDQAVDRIKLGEKMKEHGIEITFSHFFGKVVQWFLVLFLS